jgi:hypothetical protein
VALTAAHILALRAADNDGNRAPLSQRVHCELITELQQRGSDDAIVSEPRAVYKAAALITSAQNTWSISVVRKSSTWRMNPLPLSPRARSTVNATAESRAANDVVRAGSQVLLSTQQALTQSEETAAQQAKELKLLRAKNREFKRQIERSEGEIGAELRHANLNLKRQQNSWEAEKKKTAADLKEARACIGSARSVKRKLDTLQKGLAMARGKNSVKEVRAVVQELDIEISDLRKEQGTVGDTASVPLNFGLEAMKLWGTKGAAEDVNYPALSLRCA